MRIVSGTSGFAYPEWKGSFYPEGLSADAMLGHYAALLPAVEINNTFYRMPKTHVLAGWSAEVPEGFTFAIKASRFITHIRRLKDIGQPVSFLFEQLAALGEKLGPVLFQLPPNLKQDPARLDHLLEQLPVDRRVALEFRHPTWHDDEVYARLRARGVALVAVESDEEGEGSPFVPTASWGYLRLRRKEYGDVELRAWVERLAAAGWTDAFVFFKHEDAGAGPRLAKRFLEIALEV
jgi:uncharacterized protein YecE (DUF72 family)